MPKVNSCACVANSIQQKHEKYYIHTGVSKLIDIRTDAKDTSEDVVMVIAISTPLLENNNSENTALPCV